MKYTIGAPHEQALNDISTVIHQQNVDAGWWEDLHNVLDIIDTAMQDDPHEVRQLMQKKVQTWFVMSKLALVHSEISEMLEGIRKGKMDDHLPDREASEVEGADAFIRLADLMGFLQHQLGTATGEKFDYNQERPDHKKEAREGEGGKLV